MPSLVDELQQVATTSVSVTDETIAVELDDGRTIVIPTAWYPRLVHATPKDRANYEIGAVGIMWPDVEANFSISGILLVGRAASHRRR